MISSMLTKSLMVGTMLNTATRGTAPKIPVYKSGVVNASNASVFNGVSTSVSKHLAYKGVVSLLQFDRDQKKLALDFGCGLGDSTKLLSNLGFKTVGVDHDPQMIYKARRIHGDFSKFISVSDESLPFDDDTFDLVYSSFVVLEISSLESMVEYFEKAYEVLKTNGKMVVVTSNPEIYDPIRSWLALAANSNNILKSGNKVAISVTDAGVEFHDYYWTEKDLTEAATRVGFEVSRSLYPLGTNSDNIEWREETKYSTNLIIELIKK
ncbi:MAG: class I SAM-dependent methyltransferase [Oligoflexales bacterium]